MPLAALDWRGKVPMGETERPQARVGRVAVARAARAPQSHRGLAAREERGKQVPLQGQQLLARAVAGAVQASTQVEAPQPEEVARAAVSIAVQAG